MALPESTGSGNSRRSFVLKSLYSALMAMNDFDDNKAPIDSGYFITGVNVKTNRLLMIMQYQVDSASMGQVCWSH